MVYVVGAPPLVVAYARCTRTATPRSVGSASTRKAASCRPGRPPSTLEKNVRHTGSTTVFTGCEWENVPSTPRNWKALRAARVTGEPSSSAAPR
jgi:hypothetical protein